MYYYSPPNKKSGYLDLYTVFVVHSAISWKDIFNFYANRSVPHDDLIMFDDVMSDKVTVCIMGFPHVYSLTDFDSFVIKLFTKTH